MNVNHMTGKSAKSDLEEIISQQKQKLTATEEMVRILTIQNKRMARVNVQVIKELHEFAIKFGGV